MNTSPSSLRKSGGVSGEFSGTEGEDARSMGSAMATEFKGHITGDNSTDQEVVGKPNFGKLGARGVQDA